VYIKQKAFYLVRCMTLLLMFFLFPAIASAVDKQDTATTQIPVCCSADNIMEVFEFVLTGDGQDPLKLEMQDGMESGFVVEFTAPGTYHYTVRQTQGKTNGILYDDTVYAVDVYVTEDEKGKMTAEPVAYIKGSREKQEKLSFVNKRDAETRTTEKDAGDKGNGMADGKGSVNRAAKTDDASSVMSWACLLCASAALFLTIMAKKKQGKGKTCV
jgi:pilin isopeptide linkage protein